MIALLRERFGHASADRALSGPGLVNLYAAAACLAGQPTQDLTPALIGASRALGIDKFCAPALRA